MTKTATKSDPNELQDGYRWVLDRGQLKQQPVEIVAGDPNEEFEDQPTDEMTKFLLGYDPDDPWDKDGNPKLVL
jgi:hypothetical protein